MTVKKHLKTIHISILSLWDLGQGKGRVSTYIPLKALCDRGHEVWFLTNNRNQNSGKFDCINVKKLNTIMQPLNKKHLSIITTYLNLPFFIFSVIFQSLVIGRRYKPDVVYAHDIYSAIPAFIISRISGSKYILKLYGVGEETKPFYRSLPYIALKLPTDLYIITNDGTSGKKTAEKYGVSPHKICFWINGVDKSWADKPVDDKLKKSLTFSNEKIILSVCKLSADKQVDILIKAIPEVLKVYRETKFVIVGDGAERKNLENLAKNIGVSDFIRFEGAILHTKVIEYMKVCDIFVSMNSLSSICNPVLEAMTCGRPVIALNTGNTSDLIKHNYNGMLINVNEVDTFADYILLLLKNDDLRRKIGENSQRFMRDNWPAWEERVNLEVDLVEALWSNDSEKLARIKKKANDILDISIRFCDPCLENCNKMNSEILIR